MDGFTRNFGGNCARHRRRAFLQSIGCPAKLPIVVFRFFEKDPVRLAGLHPSRSHGYPLFTKRGQIFLFGQMRSARNHVSPFTRRPFGKSADSFRARSLGSKSFLILRQAQDEVKPKASSW
jgi:hypothetical protein